MIRSTSGDTPDFSSYFRDATLESDSKVFICYTFASWLFNTLAAMLENFSFVLPLFNEQRRLHHHKKILSLVKDCIVIDAGSSDSTLEILHSFDLRNLRVIVIDTSRSQARTPEWYQEVINYCNTEWILLGNAGHLYTESLLKEINSLCLNPSLKAISVPNYHYFLQYPDSSFGSHRRKFSMSTLVSRPLGKRLVLAKPLVIKHRFINWSSFRIHNELPIEKINNCNIATTTKCVYSFRDEDTCSLEIKHAKYATTHAKDLSKMQSVCPSQAGFIFTYLKHFLYCWLFKGSVIDGQRGFISAHYWASYHLSVKIRLWELHNNLNEDKVIHMNNKLRFSLLNHERML